jgi:hypothetical protein
MMRLFVAPEPQLRLASGRPLEPIHFHNRDLHSEERISFSPPSAPFRLRRHRIAILILSHGNIIIDRNRNLCITISEELNDPK